MPATQPAEQGTQHDRATRNICDRSPKVQKLLLEKLHPVSLCSVVTGEDLYNIEEFEFRGNLSNGDLNNLINLKDLQMVPLELPLPENIFSDLTNLETLQLDTDLGNAGMKSWGDKPWILNGTFTATPNLKILQIDGPNVILTKETLAGLNQLEEINIGEISSLADANFTGLESLREVKLSAKYIDEQSKERKPVFPANMIRNAPGVESWDIENFTFPRVIPYASLEQFCRVHLDHGIRENDGRPVFQVNGERVAKVSNDNGVCRVGTGEPDKHGDYPESQIKIVDGRTEATP